MIKNKAKKIVVIIVGLIITVLLSLVGITYAWLSASINRNNVSSVQIGVANLRIIFKETSNIEGTNIIPGWTSTKTFEIENLSRKTVKYEISIEDVVNELLRTEDIVYKLESETGCEVEESTYPTEDTLICEGTIGVGEKQEFTLTVRYKYEEEIDQSSDMGKTIAGRIKIDGEEIESDIGILAIYVNETEIKYNNELNQNLDYIIDTSKSECTGGETLTFNNSTKSITITPLTNKTYCKIYLISETYLYDQIIADNDGGISDNIIDFTYSSNGYAENNGILDSTKVTNGLYYTADATVSTYGENNTRIYYYRGDVDNNWVNLGGYKWRIVRTTSEGGVRLVYSGDGTSTSSGFINTSQQWASSANSSDNLKYSSSLIKKKVEKWYASWIQAQAAVPNYISETATYCNETTTDGWPLPRVRITNKRPSYACSIQGTYSKSDNSLAYPIALLSSDEIFFSGLSYAGEKNTSAYIMDNAASMSWWTMSPWAYSGSFAYIIRVYSGGYLRWILADDSDLVGVATRPAISLKPCVSIAGNGNGSFTTPYELSYVMCDE